MQVTPDCMVLFLKGRINGVVRLLTGATQTVG
jgi:hypothetical protein